ILDPATGRPARSCISVTILAPTARAADALATGVFVLGPQRGMELIERLPQVEGIIVSSEGRIFKSSGLADLNLEY
ncbi:MAG: FAD:protein FMN transferase, partial [Candidatus Bipolaricaulia bacterium]